jgi:hypothetical protein
LDGNGRKAEVTPIKSSLLGKSCGYDALEKQMERSGAKIVGDGSREQACRRIAEAFAGAPDGNELRERLKAYHIDLYIRRNEGGRITGATFIDHETRTVLNGSRLGKEYSANALQERYGTGLESGTGVAGHRPEHREPLQPTPPTVSPASETQQSRPVPQEDRSAKEEVEDGVVGIVCPKSVDNFGHIETQWKRV